MAVCIKAGLVEDRTDCNSDMFNFFLICQCSSKHFIPNKGTRENMLRFSNVSFRGRELEFSGSDHLRAPGSVACGGLRDPEFSITVTHWLPDSKGHDLGQQRGQTLKHWYPQGTSYDCLYTSVFNTLY